jgi:4-amino-4-deoxy-L-arabinose transferase-like glycosyltransferase
MPSTLMIAGSIVVLTAIAVAAYDASTNADVDPKKRFAQVLIAGGLVAGAVVFFTQESKPRISTTPYVLDAPAVPVPQVPGAVSMPST